MGVRGGRRRVRRDGLRLGGRGEERERETGMGGLKGEKMGFFRADVCSDETIDEHLSPGPGQVIDGRMEDRVPSLVDEGG